MISTISDVLWYNLYMENSCPALTEAQILALANAGVVLCYVHGSVATSTARTDSDLDIAVLLERGPAAAIHAPEVILEALCDYMPERNKDIAILNEANPLLQQTVASQGTLLYARSQDDVLRYELRAMQAYEYSRHVVRLGQELLLATPSL